MTRNNMHHQDDLYQTTMDRDLNSSYYRRDANGRRRGLYRSRQGMVFGVCKGIADHLDFSAFWLRVIIIALLFVSGFFPVVFFYILAALLMKPEPVLPLRNEQEEEFYNSYVTGRKMALMRLKRTFDSLDRRIQRMENIVTARDYSWDQRLNE